MTDTHLAGFIFSSCYPFFLVHRLMPPHKRTRNNFTHLPGAVVIDIDAGDRRPMLDGIAVDRICQEIRKRRGLSPRTRTGWISRLTGKAERLNVLLAMHHRWWQ
jgi:hypothetical protein